jgi:hypothetical protein
MWTEGAHSDRQACHHSSKQVLNLGGYLAGLCVCACVQRLVWRFISEPVGLLRCETALSQPARTDKGRVSRRLYRAEVSGRLQTPLPVIYVCI